MTEAINDQNVILIADASLSEPGQPRPGYTVTAIPPDNPPAISSLSVVQVPQALQETHYLSHLPKHLHLPSDDFHIIISTKSGSESAAEVFDNVLQPVLKAVGLEETHYHILRTESSDTINEFASGRLKARANEGLAQTVILLSGDGGVVDVVNGLMDQDDIKSSKFVRPTIVLLPLGTGNALFHSLHRPFLPPSASPATPEPTDLTLALRTLFFGTPRSLPVFRATFSPKSRLLSNHGRTALPLPASNTLYGAIVASYGLHASLVADSDTAQWRQHGAARFGMVARELLSQPHAYKAKLVMRRENGPDTVVERQEHGYILLTLVSNLEKTFTISPASAPLDGKLRVVHFGPEEGLEVGRILGLAYQGGKHVAEEKVAYDEVKGMRIEILEGDVEKDEMEGRWRRFCIDGLIVRVEQGGWMEVSEVPSAQRLADIVVARGR